MTISLKDKNINLCFKTSETGELYWLNCGLDCEIAENADLVSKVVVVDNGNDVGFYNKKIGGNGTNTYLYKSHNIVETERGHKLTIILEGEGLQLGLNFETYGKANAVRTYVTVKNISLKNIGLTYVSSFFLLGIELKGDVLVANNSWCEEFDFRSVDYKELGMHGLTGSESKRIAFSNIGTNSTKEYLPIGYSNGMMWQIENNGGWQWEIGRNGLNYIALAGPSENVGDWYKSLAPDEIFESVPAAITFGNNFEDCLKEMTQYRRIIKGRNKHFDKFPLIFNDYMHCLSADPTTEKEIAAIDAACEAGAEYFCMDAGWYAEGFWWDSVGEWIPTTGRFPNGIGEVFDYVREKGMIPGIWIEPEVMGIKCKLADELPDECFFMRHGKRVISKGRYQLDFRNQMVLDHLTKTVENFINNYGIRYFKFDYNIEGGIGTELMADSFGDGLLQHNRAYLKWLSEIMEKYPDVIFENCSSGGMRIDYAMLSTYHLQSTSDQEDFKDTSVIAANAAVAVVPEQAGVWCYPFANHSDREIEFIMVSGISGCMYLSGQMMKLNPHQMDIVKKGAAVYKKYCSSIANSYPTFPIDFARYDSTWRAVCYCNDELKKKYLFVWKSGNDSNDLSINVKCSSCKRIFPDIGADVYTVDNNVIDIHIEDECAAAFYELSY